MNPVYEMDSNIALSTNQQRLLRERHHFVLRNMTDGREVASLDRILKSEVLEYINCNDSLGFRIRFKPHCQDSDLHFSQDIMGTLMSTEPCSIENQAAAGAIGQDIIDTMEFTLGHRRMLSLVPSPHIMIGLLHQRA